MDAIYTYVRRTWTLMLWFIGVQGVWFFYDLLFHAHLSYPFWNEQYNWWPVIVGAIAGTMAASALWMAAERTSPLLFVRSLRQLRSYVAVATMVNARTMSNTALTQLREAAKPKRQQLVQ